MSKSNSLTGRVISGITWSYVSVIFQVLLRVGVLAILARLLTPKDFGIVGIALIFTSFAERLGQFGVGPAIVQREELTERHIRVALSLSILCGAGICLFLWSISSWVAEFFHQPEVAPVLSWVALAFVIDGLGMVSEALLQRHIRFGAFTIVENLSYFLGQGVVGVCTALAGWGVWSLVAALLSSRFFRTIALLILEPLNFRLILRKKEAGELMRLGVGFSVGRLLSLGALQGDNFVVGRMLGVFELGLYSRAYQLMTIPAVYFGQALERVIFPAMARKQSNRTALSSAFLDMTEAMGVVALPASILMLLTSRELVLFLFGEKWIEIVPVLEVLCLGVFARTAYKTGDSLARSLGALKLFTYTQLAYTISVIGGSVIGAAYYGLLGVAVAVLVAVTLNYILMTRLSCVLLDLPVSKMVEAHCPAAWISIWVAITGLPVLLICREAHLMPVIILAIIGLVSLIATYLSLAFGPRRFKLQFLNRLASHLPLHRMGPVGPVVRYGMSKIIR